jgi:hypothetical protein
MRVFKALKTFDSDDLRSTYLKDFSYTIDANNKLLNACAEVWALQGKVQFDHIVTSHAKLKGAGRVETRGVDVGFWNLTKTGWRSLWR